MEKMNCDIIQDLIPSYVDDICSAATRNCVEEHIKDCAECREIAAFCQRSALSANKAEEAVIDTFGKIKKKMKYQLIGNAALIILICFCLQRFLNNTAHLILSFSILLTAGMSANLLTTTARHTGCRPKKADYAVGIFSLIITLGSAMIFYYVVKKSLTATTPIFFGLEARQCGPLLSRLFFAAFIVQLALYLYYFLTGPSIPPVAHENKQYINHGALSCLTVTGIFLPSAYLALLRRLDTPESFLQIFAEINTISIIACALGFFAGLLSARKKRKFF